MAAKKTTGEKRVQMSPNPKQQYDLTGLLAALDANQNNFAETFATRLKFGNLGDTNSIAWVDERFEPTEKELEAFGIPASQWGPMRKCTESGLLVLAKCLEKAPQVFR